MSNGRGCRDGWVEFTCNYQSSGFTLTKLGQALIQSYKTDEWETTNSGSLYHDTKNKKVRVIIKKLKQDDFAEYQCEEQGSASNTVKLDKGKRHFNVFFINSKLKLDEGFALRKHE